ncbi:MAG TPA: hypothetical protein VKG63_01870 [Steroidobacteraceae bacterium]|nr:hypothetical protein [Steroidobacteraceae bacterium]
MKRFAGVKVAGLSIALGVFGLTLGGEAGAGCSNFTSPAGLGGAARFKPAVYRLADGDSGAFLSVSSGEYWGGSIIGLWKVEFLAKGNTNGIPDGALIDFGTATWNGDGTETMVSGGRDPSTGDVCMGAWEQTGRSTFKLSHLAMAWRAGAYVGPAAIKETVTLDPSGNTFHGTFTITQYMASVAPGQEFDESTVVPPTPIYGVITGTRVAAD